LAFTRGLDTSDILVASGEAGGRKFSLGIGGSGESLFVGLKIRKGLCCGGSVGARIYWIDEVFSLSEELSEGGFGKGVWGIVALISAVAFGNGVAKSSNELLDNVKTGQVAGKRPTPNQTVADACPYTWALRQ